MGDGDIGRVTVNARKTRDNDFIPSGKNTGMGVTNLRKMVETRQEYATPIGDISQKMLRW